MNNESGRTLILTGGNLKSDFLEDLLDVQRFQTIICVDGALAIIDQMNLNIDWLIGDFDSVSPNLLHKYEELAESGQISTRIRKYNPEKDDTDTQIAIKLAIELESAEIVVAGATGSRLDHTFGNIYLLLQPLSHGIKASIIDENNKIYLINQNIVIKKEEQYGNYVSLLPFTEQVTKVTLKGFKYPLDQYLLTKEHCIGISNEVVDEEGSITLEKGILLVAESKD